MFNALKYTQELEKAGFSRDQAEASMRILIDVMNENFATKSDLKELESRMDSKFEKVYARFEKLETSLDARFKEQDYKLTIKLGGMLVVASGVTATLVQLFSRL